MTHSANASAARGQDDMVKVGRGDGLQQVVAVDPIGPRLDYRKFERAPLTGFVAAIAVTDTLLHLAVESRDAHSKFVGFGLSDPVIGKRGAQVDCPQPGNRGNVVVADHLVVLFPNSQQLAAIVRLTLLLDPFGQLGVGTQVRDHLVEGALGVLLAVRQALAERLAAARVVAVRGHGVDCGIGLVARRRGRACRTPPGAQIELLVLRDQRAQALQLIEI